MNAMDERALPPSTVPLHVKELLRAGVVCAKPGVHHLLNRIEPTIGASP